MILISGSFVTPTLIMDRLNLSAMTRIKAEPPRYVRYDPVVVLSCCKECGQDLVLGIDSLTESRTVSTVSGA